jgi:hypothetical protein
MQFDFNKLGAVINIHLQRGMAIAVLALEILIFMSRKRWNNGVLC